MEPVLVTGGGGFLGKALVKKLRVHNYAVTSFSRRHHPSLARMGVPQIQGDLTDADAVKKAVTGMETVFHVAAKPGVWGSYDTYYAVNVTGTGHVVKACRAQGVKRLIYTSSPSVIFDESDMENVDESVSYPKTYLAPYPETKAIAEKKVRQAATQGLDVIILRPHLIWGPEDNHLVPGILKRAGRLKIVGRVDDLVDTIYVDNAALAHVLAAQKLKENPSLSGNIYFISQDEPVSKWALANAFLEAAGLPLIKGHVSARTAYAAGWCFEKIYGLLGIISEPPMTRFMAKELATSHWFNITRAKTDLGYYPEISTQEGLRRLKAWLSRNG
ncbi:NAD-dependent epimerase/dehydratase family protein [Desulfotignum balticum]|jgi:nucleoside-diphosphate-sugar epimerase|uniref:NAD-dependent epimerase/dehydratase family protein n=1 Tax=Desulfotignum balticum TaxID=115781 RepID=UPI00042A7BA4|nr:NAD-dependent epimerase/dehydratase family protein [Desulfotignum balticum]